MRLYSSLILSFFAVMIFSASCKKDQLLEQGGELRFSADTLTFDTVFTSLGSFTLSVKIYNPQDRDVKVSSVKLCNGNNSFFHLNVNGISGNEVNGIDLAANDSFYVFATVNIDPTQADNPFIIEDKLIATLNGRDYAIPLIAYGQNAYYYVDTVIDQSITWLTNKPYVIMKNALVDKGVTLTIPAGVRVYMHADSRLFVEGTLKVNGTKQDTVVFQGDRLDRAYFGYEGFPGEWGGLYFTSNSKDNELNWAIIKNCGSSTKLGESVFQPAAIQVNPDSGFGSGPQLFLNHTIIENSFGYGILSFGGSIKAQNTLVHNTGQQALGILQGGSYQFDNCDFINYFPKRVSHIDQPTVAVLNYFDVSSTEYVSGNLLASFQNCLIYGSLENELLVNKRAAAPGENFDVSFTNCLIQSKDGLPAFATTSAVIFNQDPLFTDYKMWNFRPLSGSPLLGNGISIPGVITDLDDRPWLSPYAIGCYQGL